MRVLPCGDAAILVELDRPDVDREPAPGPPAFTAADLAAAVSANPPAGLVDVVPAERTVLVRVTPGADLAGVTRHVLGLDPTPAPEAGRTERVAVRVTYDGPDLGRVAELTGLEVAEIIAAHTETEWTVAFCGFAPGFGYLTGGDPRLVVPRRDSPRPRVPRGSVALAGPYSAVYPGESPGGWQLIGRTDAAVWDSDRDPPALLQPGTRVRFTTGP